MELLQIPFCLMIIVADLRERAIPVWQLAGLLISALLSSLYANTFKEVVLNSSITLIMLIIMVLLSKLAVVFLFKKSEFIDHYLGKADIVIMGACSFFLSPQVWLKLMMFSFVTGIALFLVMRKRNYHEKEIPLAAIISAVYAVLLILSYSIGTTSLESSISSFGI